MNPQSFKTIKFDARYKRDILSGKKIATVRTELKAEVGDEIEMAFSDGTTAQGWIQEIYSTTFADSIRKYHFFEGYKTPWEMYNDLVRIYPNLRDGDRVYIHVFHWVKEVQPDFYEIRRSNLSKKPELFMECTDVRGKNVVIHVISEEEADQIICSKKDDDGDYPCKGRFLIIYPGEPVVTAIDNRSGDAFTEDFHHWHFAVEWLLDFTLYYDDYIESHNLDLLKSSGKAVPEEVV